MDRRAQLEQWLTELYPSEPYRLAPASADASFRRYFRVTFENRSPRSLIAMDAPPEQEDCRPFVKVAGLLTEAGLNAPHIVAQSLDQGFLLLTDLGTQTFLHAINTDNADALYRDATDALIQWQLASRPGVLPEYDAALLRREVQLFPEWYLGRHLGLELSEAQRQMLDRIFELIIQSNLAQPKVYVHRDYMPRNLMISTPNPGILDFQDAVYGPIAYDVLSLFKDAFLSWEEERVLDWTIRYWEKARRANLPVPADFADFYRDFEWMGVQRHLKVAGIFARLHYRDGKSGYLDDTPRFIAYIRAVCRRYDALSPLLRLLDDIEGVTPAHGYTF